MLILLKDWVHNSTKDFKKILQKMAEQSEFHQWIMDKITSKDPCKNKFHERFADKMPI